VCRRSTTTCSTCRHFRRAVAGQLGYCGLERRRAPLSGDEIRGCWQAAPETRLPEAALATSIRSIGTGRRPRLDFVPVSRGDDPLERSPETGYRSTDGLRRPPQAEDAVADPAVLRFIFWDDIEG
jgi:hypothetical protein